MEKELRELTSEVTLLQNKLAEKRRILEGLLRRQDELSQSSSTGLSARLKEAAEQAEVRMRFGSPDRSNDGDGGRCSFLCLSSFIIRPSRRPFRRIWWRDASPRRTL